MRLFITGDAGFIGSNHVRHGLASTDDSVTGYDALTYAATSTTSKASTTIPASPSSRATSATVGEEWGEACRLP